VHGRQAEARRNDLAVLEAARDVFGTRGADAPISAVADRAGVGMGTLYRRYGSKTELLQHLCVLAMEQTLEAADEALRADDAWAGLAGYVRACIELRSGALASLAGQIDTTAEMRSTARRSLTRVADIVERAQRDGGMRADVTPLDVTWLIEQFSRRAPDPVDPEEESNARSRLVAIALDGLRARPAEALPGRPPSRARYVNRWSQLRGGVAGCSATGWRRVRRWLRPSGPRPMGGVLTRLAADVMRYRALVSCQQVRDHVVRGSDDHASGGGQPVRRAGGPVRA
jgi:AcrR family transcriptional regulator